MNNDITPGVNIGTANPGAPPTQVATGVNNAAPPPSAPSPTPPPGPRLSSRRALGLSLIAVAVLAGAALAWYSAQVAKRNQSAALLESSQRIKPQAVALSSLANQLHATATSSANTLTVNGQADIAGSIVLEPSGQPANAAAGELYYDSATNLLSYYNGSHFVGLPGGGNTLVTNNSITNVAGPTNTTNVAGATNITNNITNVTGGGVGETTGTAGSIAMFTAANVIGPSLISQNGSNLDTGSGVENVTLGSLSATSATNLQGGTGGLTLVTGDTAGSSGGINIASGASSTSASGNVNLDTGAGLVTGTVVQNDDFETDTAGIDPWILPSTAVQDCTVAHTGSCSLAVTGSNFWGVLQDDIHGVPVTAGHHYFFSAWVRAATGAAKIGGRIIWNSGPFNTQFLALPTTTSSTSGWIQMSISGVAPAGATRGVIVFNSPDGSTSNGTQYFDDVVVTDLSTSSAVSELDLGATNAQILTIGNMNEIGTTTINGGSGIALNSGVAGFNINGGAITINGSGASSLGTSSGSLTVSATSTSDWGLGTTASGDGGDLTVHAGTAAAGDNNGGNLILQAGAATGSGMSGSVLTGSNTSKVGYSSIGGTHDSNAENAMSANRITAASSGTIRAISFYVGAAGAFPNNKFQLAIYADGAACGSLPSCPGSLIASTTDQTVVPNSWNTVPINVNVAAGTPYWLAWNNNAINGADNEAYFDANGLGSHIAVTGQTYGTWPGTFPTGGALTNTASISIYADEAISGGGSGYAESTDYVGRTTFNNDTSVNSTGTQAFQIQNSTGTALLTADTAGMNITVQALVVTADLTVNGHIITGGTTPGIAAGPGACTGPTVSIVGNDTTGTITVTTGTGCSGAGGGTLATVTFVKPYAAAPHVMVTPGSPISQTLGDYVDDATTTTTKFDLAANATPLDNTTFKWNYWVAQ